MGDTSDGAIDKFWDKEDEGSLETGALMRINAHEEVLLPVELKVRMLMEQASMRMRCSAMVGERIALLEDVVRVKALLAIIKPGNTSKAGDSAGRCAKARECPSPEEISMFTRMAVAAVKNVLFQISEEGRADDSKDASELYENVATTDEICSEAKRGFAEIDAESLMSAEQLRWRRLIGARHRYLLHKLGVMLDMGEELDTLLKLAEEPADELAVDLVDVELEDTCAASDASEATTGTSSTATAADVIAEDERMHGIEVDAAKAQPEELGARMSSDSADTLPTAGWKKAENETDDEAGSTECETDEETPTMDGGDSS